MSTVVEPRTPDGGEWAEGEARDAAEREAGLVAWFRARRPILIGYSGGVDSAYLAAVALAAVGAADVLAVVGRSASYPLAQWETARDIAHRLGLPLLEVDTNELADARYAANPANRCYFCKSILWDALAPIAAARGMTIVDGTNADDLADHRPGAAAARERGVRSPLAELGFTKAAVRRRSQLRGLAGWDRPSAPCLASRIPYGTAVTGERLARVERAEAALRALGVAGDLRVRLHGDLARVELTPEAIARWSAPERAGVLRAALADAGFRRVALDLRGFRSGSLNVLGGVVAG